MKNAFPLLLLILVAHQPLAAIQRYHLDAQRDFQPSTDPAFVPFYKDQRKDLDPKPLAVNAARFPGAFAAAEVEFRGSPGNYSNVLEALTEKDGESTYQLFVNGYDFGPRTNPRMEEEFVTIPHTWTDVSLAPGDLIRIAFNSHSNGIYPEGDGYAWSRGRWIALQLIRRDPSPTLASGQWQPFELRLATHRQASAAGQPNELAAVLKTPSGDSRVLPGTALSAFEGRVRFAPEEIGRWHYLIAYADGSASREGEFWISPSKRTGRVSVLAGTNLWLGNGHGQPLLLNTAPAAPGLTSGGMSREAIRSYLESLRESKVNGLVVSEIPRKESGGQAGLPDFARLESTIDLVEQIGFYLRFSDAAWQTVPEPERHHLRVLLESYWNVLPETPFDQERYLQSWLGLLETPEGNPEDPARRFYAALESLPYYLLDPEEPIRPDTPVLSKPGRYVLVNLLGSPQAELHLGEGHYQLNWLNIRSEESRLAEAQVTGTVQLQTPDSKPGWLAWLVRTELPEAVPEPLRTPMRIGIGAYPDLAVGADGKLHLVYARQHALFYRQLDPSTGDLSPAEDTGIRYSGANNDGPHRGDPEIVLDSRGRAHVSVGNHYGYRSSAGWTSIRSGAARDNALAIDSADNLFMVRRGGFHGGHVGVLVKPRGEGSFQALPTDPDIGTPERSAWLGGDHPYGSLCVGPDNTIHVVYRQGKPDYIAYRRSVDQGQSWSGTGVYGRDTWQGEAPHITLSPTGEVYVVGPWGHLFRRDPALDRFQLMGRPLAGGGRHHPDIVAADDEVSYIAEYGGRIAIQKGRTTMISRTLPRNGSNQLGFVSLAGTPDGQGVFAFYEVGQDLNPESLREHSELYLTVVSQEGIVGRGY